MKTPYKLEKFIPFVVATACLFAVALPALAQPAPIRIGFDGEFGVRNGTSAQAIDMGLRTAAAEINAKGGLLGGRPIEIVSRDNRSVPARGVENIREMAAMPDMIAVVGGRFSPVMMQQIELFHDLKMILMNAWGSADGVTDHNFRPSFTFRVSLKDQFAMPTMLNHAREKGFKRVGLVLPNTAWGRSNDAAAHLYATTSPDVEVVGREWYNWGDRNFLAAYRRLLGLGVEAVVMVVNDLEGAALVQQIAELPKEERVPLISHWGITGGDFVSRVGDALNGVDLVVVQTFSFDRLAEDRKARLFKQVNDLFGPDRRDHEISAVGFAHAYDIVYILAAAVEAAQTTDRLTLRSTLETLGPIDGLVRHYDQPFTPERHDALMAEDVFLARFNSAGKLVPIGGAE